MNFISVCKIINAPHFRILVKSGQRFHQKEINIVIICIIISSTIVNIVINVIIVTISILYIMINVSMALISISTLSNNDSRLLYALKAWSFRSYNSTVCVTNSWVYGQCVYTMWHIPLLCLYISVYSLYSMWIKTPCKKLI